MKIWNKLKHPLLLIVLTLALAFLRYVSYACPVWCPYVFWAPGLYLQILSDALFSSKYVLMEIVFWPVALGAFLLVPADEQYGCTRRSLLRLVLPLLVVLGLSSFAIASNDRWEQDAFDRKREASHQQIRDFIQIADEAVWYSNDYYDGYTEEFPELVRPIWAGNQSPHITDTILIDYDSKTVGFAYHYVSYFVLKDISLSQEFTVPSFSNETNTVILGQPGTELKLYYNYKDGAVGNGYDVVCITLTMADGTVYGTNDLTDPETGRNYFLSLPTADSAFARIEDFLQRKKP